jgi:hypothetical protein
MTADRTERTRMRKKRRTMVYERNFCSGVFLSFEEIVISGACTAVFLGFMGVRLSGGRYYTKVLTEIRKPPHRTRKRRSKPDVTSRNRPERWLHPKARK